MEVFLIILVLIFGIAFLMAFRFFLDITETALLSIRELQIKLDRIEHKGE